MAMPESKSQSGFTAGQTASNTIAVIGAGPAGLFCALALIDQGYNVALFESHSKPGGCASYFRRRFELSGAPVVKRAPLESDTFALFDAGATVLNGLQGHNTKTVDPKEKQFLSRLLDRAGIKIDAHYEELAAIHMKLPGEPTVALACKSYAQYLDALRKAFPEDRALIDTYFTRLAECAELLALAFQKIPHMPIQNAWDLKQALRLAPEMLKIFPEFAMGYARTFGEELGRRGISARLRKWVEMNLLITLQCPPEQAHPLYGALALFFYPMGSGTLAGGMKSLFLPVLEHIKTHPKARVFMRTPVTKITRRPDGKFCIKTPAQEFGAFDAVFSSIPRFDTQSLSSASLISNDQEFEAIKTDLWSALVAYVVVQDDDRMPESAFHLHSARSWEYASAPNGGDAYLSFSRRGDTLKTAAGTRSLTISTHVPLRECERFFTGDFNAGEKLEMGRTLLRPHLEEAFPGLKILFDEYGSPRTFFRYTRRRLGTVGGIPLSLRFSFLNAPSQRSHQKGIYLIGDTSFPGQSVYACAVGACAAVEKFTHKRLHI